MTQFEIEVRTDCGGKTVRSTFSNYLGHFFSVKQSYIEREIENESMQILNGDNMSSTPAAG